MKFKSPMLLAAALISTASLCSASQSLNSTCTPSYISSLVSAFGNLDAVTYHLDNITATIVTNYTATPSSMGPMFPTASGLEFCNVTLSMSHDNLDDDVSSTSTLDKAVH